MADVQRTAILAAADRQYSYLKASLDETAVARARFHLAREADEIAACAQVQQEICSSLDLTSHRQIFAGQLLAVAAIRIAKAEADHG